MTGDASFGIETNRASKISRSVDQRLRECILSHDDKSKSEDVWFSRSVTSACYAKPVLHFVTVFRQSHDNYVLVERRCSSFQYNQRSPAATRELSIKIKRLFCGWSPGRLVLRTGGLRGTYVPHPLGFKVEALLDLEFADELFRVGAASVACWSKKQQFDMPGPQDSGFSPSWRSGQFKAIEAAVYALNGGKRQSDGARKI